MYVRCARVLCLGILLLGAPALLTAQATATINGTIRDGTGAVVPTVPAVQIAQNRQ